MRKIFITIVFLVFGKVFSQTSTATDGDSYPSNKVNDNITALYPASPEASKLGRYGNSPVGYFTGTPQINIPLFTFKYGDISFPINLFYSSNGIKVDDLNGAAGLGWTLRNTGVITRLIRGIADDKSSNGTVETPDITKLGWNDPSVLKYLEYCEAEGFDSEPDLYLVEAAGINLKFIIKRNGDILQMDQSGSTIKRDLDGFTITTHDGTVYKFQAAEKVKNTTTNVGLHGGVSIDDTAWYLTEISDVRHRKIKFEYNNINYTTVTGQSQSMIYTTKPQQKWGKPYDTGQPFYPTTCDIFLYQIPGNIGLISQHIQTVFGKQLKRIYTSNNEEVSFTYSQQPNDVDLLHNIKLKKQNTIIKDIDFEYYTNNVGRTFLIKVTDRKLNSHHQFDYYNAVEVPQRLSLSRDIWGYYNGANNKTLIPKIPEINFQYNGANQEVNPSVGYFGLLKSVKYPTGGKSEFKYENHVIKELVAIPPDTPIKTISLNARTDNSGTIATNSIFFTPGAASMAELFLGDYLNQNEQCRESPHAELKKQRATISIKEPSGKFVELYREGYNGTYYPVGTSYSVSIDDNIRLFFPTKENLKLIATLSAHFFCSDAYAKINYKVEDVIRYEVKDTPLGGYRIKSIADYPTEGFPINRLFIYKYRNGNYSTHKVKAPYFLQERHTKLYCPGSLSNTALDFTYHSLTSSNINTYNSMHPNIFYDFVREEVIGKGWVDHYFHTDIDTPGLNLGDYISGTAWSNTSFRTGKEYQTDFVNKSGRILKSIKNNYKQDYVNTTFALGVRKKYDRVFSEDSNIIYFDNLDLVFYKNINRLSYNNEKIITDYFPDGKKIIKTVNYQYNNPKHYQVTKQEMIVNGEKTITNFSYAHEKNNQYLIDKNIIGIPLHTTTTKNGKTINNVEIKYPTTQNEANTKTKGLPAPYAVWEYNLQSNIAATALTYDLYDPAHGNLLQYSDKGLIPTTIIWGYDNTQPIAKIEGATYAQVSSLVAAIVMASNTDAGAAPGASETSLLNALNTFRSNSALAGYQITTYTYDPLIGVRSITPPSGITEFYEYDAAGRLKTVKDINGKVLKENQYHYKP